MKFEEKKIVKEKFYSARNPIKIWDVNVDNIVFSKLVKTKTNSRYLNWIKFDKAVISLVLKWVDMLRHLKLTLQS